MAKQSEETPLPEEQTSGPRKKDRPTPKREDQEAARKRPLIPDREKAKQRMREVREESRKGYERGDDRFLPARERGKQRRFVRDFVDSRFSIGEAVIPTMFVLIIAMSLPQPIDVIAVMVLWVVFISAVIDILLMNRRLVKKIQEKFGQDSLEKGTKWYAGMRAIQMRFLRLPKPQVKYGEKPY